MMIDWSGIRHFKPSEFDSPDAPGSGIKMDVDFVRKLDELRERCGFAFVINSGYRTALRNVRVGGVDSSSHTAGLAADIRAETSTARFRIVSEALELGFRRIGIGQTFVHLDIDSSKTPDVIWLYSK